MSNNILQKGYSMNKNFTLASILLTNILLQTGCAPKITPIIPNTSSRENNAQTYTETYSQHTPITANTTNVEVIPATTYVTQDTTIQYENQIDPITTQEETFETYPSEQIETSTIDNSVSSMQETPSPVSSGSGGYQIQSINGQSIGVIEQSTGLNFPQYQGKVILLQIFGKNCEFCFEELPIIHRIQNKYQNKLQIIAIQGQEKMTPSTASRLISKYRMNYPIIERNEAIDLLSYIGSTYNWTGVLPFIQVIKDGVTEATFSDGGVSYNELSELIDTL